MKPSYFDYMFALRMYDDYITSSRLAYHLGAKRNEEVPERVQVDLLQLQKFGVAILQEHDDGTYVKLTYFGNVLTDKLADVAIDRMLGRENLLPAGI